MAKAITDSVALEIAKSICEPSEKWTSDCHAQFIWKYFRQAGFLKGAKPEEIKAAGMAWAAMHNNARLAYASNQAKGLADAGVCIASTAPASAAEFE